MLSTLRTALLCAALSCSCSRAPVAATPALVPQLTIDEVSLPAPRERIDASPAEPLHRAGRRPLLVATIPFAYTSLPVVGPPDPARGERGSFELRSKEQGHYALRIADDLLAEVELASRRFHTRLRPRAIIPRPRSMPAQSPPCGPAGGLAGSDVTTAAWEGIRVSTWQDDAIDYVRYRGAFDLVACRGTPTSVVRTKAIALVPKLLYAQRSCARGCLAEVDDRPREEVLTIIGPSSAWASATVDASEQRRPHLGTFSHVDVRVVRGGSASALLTLSGEDLAHFVGLRDRESRATLESEQLREEIMQLTIEVVWLESEPAPSGTVYVAAPATLHSAELLRAVLPATLLAP